MTKANGLRPGTLSVRQKLAYGVGDVGNAAVNSAIQFFLMIFYTDAVMAPPALVASALLVAKVWDAVNDPLFGWISDHTSSRFGRRRVYMIFGAAPLSLSIMLLWFVPIGWSGVALFSWIAGSFILFDTMWTLTNVPYYALSAELTDDYDERSSLTAFRMTLSVPAYIVGAALTPALVGMFATKRTGYGMVGVCYGMLAATSLWVASAGLRERASIRREKTGAPPVKAFLSAFGNRPFVILLGAYVIANGAFALTKILLAYYLIYQLKMESQVPMVMFTMLAFVVAALFPWKKVAERWSKGPAYALGLAIGGLSVGASFLLPHRPTAWVYVIAAVAGIGFSSNWVFPWAMVPDVVDHDRVTSGESRSGIYFGVWGLFYKASEAIALAVSGWVLQGAGYVPNIEQGPGALLWIRLFFGPIPAILIAVSLPFLIFYPITRATHEEVRRKLSVSEASATA